MIGLPAVSAAPQQAAAASAQDLTAFLLKCGQALSLQDYNTRVVVIGTTLLGLAAGLIGTFAYLRKRALMGDALSHATLPGIAAAFLIAGTKQPGILIAGAALAGVIAILALLGLRKYTRLKEDAAIGIVLSVSFAAGLVLLSIVQQTGSGGQAGLQSFIYGRAAALVRRDAVLIAWVAGGVSAGVILLFRQFRLICFDQDFASVSGHAVVWIDLGMMALIIATTVVGLQAVGLIMIIALLIIPAAAARFWTDSLVLMSILAAAFGACSGWAGSACSAVLPRMPTGAIIVICAGVVFVISMLMAPRRGVLGNLWRQWSLSRRVHDQHLLRAFVESEETRGHVVELEFDALLQRRSWAAPQLRRALWRACRRGDLAVLVGGRWRLTAEGRAQAARLLRNHRLWEMYLIRYADIAPSHVDRDADEVEHVLSAALIRELEAALESQGAIPACPHSLEAPRP